MSVERNTSPRKILGQLSTNVQLTPKVPGPSQKALSYTAPLKRSFKSAIGDNGFQYLKRRRLSSSALFTGLAQSTEHAAGGNIELAAPTRMLLSSATEPDESTTPQTPLEEDPADKDRESSSERHSFSSLINYDPSSQTGPSSQGRFRATSTEAAPTVILSRAEVLRTRLQMAMYKVRTQQTAVPFEYLREDTVNGSRESSKAVQEAVEQLRKEAYLRLSLKPSTTRSLDSTVSDPAQLPASPERMQSDDRLDLLLVTPNVRNDKASPIKRLQAGQDLTSSAVKGQVAEGLLGLKNGF